MHFKKFQTHKSISFYSKQSHNIITTHNYDNSMTSYTYISFIDPCLPLRGGSFCISLFRLILKRDEPFLLLLRCTRGLEVCNLLITPVKVLGAASY